MAPRLRQLRLRCLQLLEQGAALGALRDDGRIQKPSTMLTITMSRKSQITGSVSAKGAPASCSTTVAATSSPQAISA